MSEKTNEGDEWFYEEKGERKGAVSETEMIALINNGTVSYGTSVWKQGFPDWLNVENTNLREHLGKASPPPLKGENINNTMAWLAAFTPIIGLFLEYVIAGAMYDGNELAAAIAVRSGKLFYVTLGLHILFCYLDERKLKKAGYNTAKFRGWVWLVPVYLFQRAKALKQTPSYFWVWIVMFILMIAESA